MPNENGTRLARQVRRFIEKHPAGKSVENVTEDAKEMILELGNPDYFADKSEEFEPFPPEWRLKKSFESKYKKLREEYPNLPDLRGKATQTENTKKKDDDEARKAREAADDEAKKKADEARKKVDDEARKKADEAKKKANEEARKAREAADDEAKKKADEAKKKADEAKKKADEAKKKADEAKKNANDEAEMDGLRDKLKSMDPDQLQALLQDLEISGSGRGSRETTADTSSSWNTRGSSVDPMSTDPGHWRKVRETFGDDSEYWLNKLSEASKEHDCDFADVMFYLEYLLRQDADRNAPDLGGLALDFIDERPASQAQFVKELRDRDPQLYRAHNAYYASSWISGKKKERRPWARNPQAYRDRALEIFPPELDENWDQITIFVDPDTKEEMVKGRITASIKEYLDVCLDSLRDNDEERHILVKRSDYLNEAQRFEGTQRGRHLTLKPETRAILKGRKKSDIKILNYAVAAQPFMSSSIKLFFVGIDKKQKTVIRAWTKTEFCAYATFKPGLADVNEQRKACGQQELFRVPKLDVPWPHQDSDSDSESSFESDVEQVLAV